MQKALAPHFLEKVVVWQSGYGLSISPSLSCFYSGSEIKLKGKKSVLLFQTEIQTSITETILKICRNYAEYYFISGNVS